MVTPVQSDSDTMEQDQANGSSEVQQSQKATTVPSLKDQRETIDFYCKAKLEEGDFWFVVEVKWWQSFKRYVNYDGTSQEGITEYPGAIDNEPLTVPSSSASSLPKLQRYLREHYDFTVVPELAWEKLVEWYGGGPSIPRKVIVEGYTRLRKIELYPHFVQVAIYNKKNSYSFKELMFSKTDTLTSVKEEAAKALDVNVDAETRLWAAHMNTPFRCYDSVDEEKELEAVDTRIIGLQLLLEVKGEDGWPLAQKHKTSITTSAPSTMDVVAVGPVTTVSSGSRLSGRSALDSYGSSMGSIYSSNFGSSYNSYGGGYGSGSMGYDNKNYTSKSTNALPGVAGLSNLGNTCFMNSALQCLTKTMHIKDYFVAGTYKSEINPDNPLGMGGKIAKAFGDLMEDMWSGGNSYVTPVSFKRTIGNFAPQFSGYQQQDSQELIAYLLDGLHEDLNRVKNKPMTEQITSDGRPDTEVAAASWIQHKKRNDSVIVDRFQAQLKSTLICPDCEHVSITFDPYMYLSLPLPTERTRVIDITLFRADDFVATKYGVKVSKRGFIKEVRQKLGEASGIRAEDLVLTEIFSNKIYRFLPDTAQTGSIQDNDTIYAYELRGLTENHHNCYDAYASRVPAPFLAVRIYTTERSTYAGMTTDRAIPIGTPFVLEYDKKITTKKQLYDGCLAYVKKYLKQGVEKELGIDLNNPVDIFPAKPTATPAAPTTVPAPASSSSQDAAMGDEEAAAPAPAPVPQKKNYLFTLKLESVYEQENSSGILDYTDEIVAERPSQYSTYSYDKKNVIMHIDPQLLQHLVDNDKLTQHRDDESVDGERGGSKNITLNDCLNLFTTVEQLGPEDPWYCPKCKKFVQATKKFDIFSVPDVLVIHLKRFQYTRMFRDKIESFVDYPLANLDLRPYLPPANSANAVYNLFAVSNHFGGLGGGHYTACAKVGNQWYKFDDSYASLTDDESVRSKSGYVLFYARNTPTSTTAASTSSANSVGSNGSGLEHGDVDN